MTFPGVSPEPQTCPVCDSETIEPIETVSSGLTHCCLDCGAEFNETKSRIVPNSADTPPPIHSRAESRKDEQQPSEQHLSSNVFICDGCEEPVLTPPTAVLVRTRDRVQEEADGVDENPLALCTMCTDEVLESYRPPA